MAVLFPRARAWKNFFLHAFSAKCRRQVARVRLRHWPIGTDLTLRVRGTVRAENAFDGDQDRPSRWLIQPAEMPPLTLPRTIETRDPAGFEGLLPFRQPAVYAYRFRPGLYHGLCGAIIDRSGRAFEDLADAAAGYLRPQLQAVRKTEARFYPGDALALSSSRIYYHWLIKMLPRLHLVAKGSPLDGRKPILLVNDPTPVQAEAYALLGFGRERLQIVRSRQFWWCRDLYATTLAHEPQPWALDFLRRAFSPIWQNTPTGPEAIYLARGKVDRRRVLNEDEVSAHLEGRGIRTVDLSQHSFREQIEIIARARLIIATHGSALSNLAFAQPGTRVLEIFNVANLQKCFWIMAQYLGITYHYVMAAPVGQPDELAQFDATIPLEKLDRAIDFLLADKRVA